MQLRYLQRLFSVATTISSTRAYLVDPPTTAASDTVSDCSLWEVVKSTDTCDSLAADWQILAAAFRSYAYNPSVGSSCNLVVGNSYCIERNWGLTPETSAPTTAASPTAESSKPSSTTPANGISTPSPIQPGMTSNCKGFYLVKENDICYTIIKNHDITLEQFYAWNPAVGSTCSTMWPNNYVCISIIGGSPSTSIIEPTPTSTRPWERPLPCTFDRSKGEYVCPSRTPIPTNSGNGIPTPTPFQSGMTNNCKKFYKTVEGEDCWGVANKNKIDLNDFYKWNPGVGSGCTTMWKNVYVCVGA